MVKWSKIGGQSMENVMSAKDRLLTQQAALQKRGVKDVKFCVSVNSEMSVAELAQDVAEVLEAVEKGGRAREISSFAELSAG